MTYVRDMTPTELRQHMDRLKKTPGWHEPLADSLYAEIKRLDDKRHSDAERLAFDYAAMCGELASVVEWCVNNDGETLGDNPHQRAIARRVLAAAKAKRPD